MIPEWSKALSLIALSLSQHEGPALIAEWSKALSLIALFQHRGLAMFNSVQYEALALLRVASLRYKASLFMPWH